MKSFDNLSPKEQERGYEMLIFIFESSEIEFQAFTGIIPMTQELYRRVAVCLRDNRCYQLLKDFARKHPDFLIP